MRPEYESLDASVCNARDAAVAEVRCARLKAGGLISLAAVAVLAVIIWIGSAVGYGNSYTGVTTYGLDVPSVEDDWTITAMHLDDCSDGTLFAVYYNNPDGCLDVGGDYRRTHCEDADFVVDMYDDTEDDTCSGSFTTDVQPTPSCEQRETKWEDRYCAVNLPEEIDPNSFPWDVYVFGGEYGEGDCGIDSHRVNIYWVPEVCQNSYADNYTTQQFLAHGSSAHLVDLYLYDSDDCSGEAAVESMHIGTCTQLGDKYFQVYEFKV